MGSVSRQASTGLAHAAAAASTLHLLLILLLLDSCPDAVQGHSGHSRDKRMDHDLREAVNDDAHIQEHLRDDYGLNVSTDNMTDEEKGYYYFRLHDTDKNSKLDGIELLQGWMHYMTEENITMTQDKFDEVVEALDGMLKHSDKNRDGYFDYGEYQKMISMD